MGSSINHSSIAMPAIFDKKYKLGCSHNTNPTQILKIMTITDRMGLMKVRGCFYRLKLYLIPSHKS